MTKKYNKLVRDKIPEYIIEKGGKPEFHVADEKEYIAKLKEKLQEELDEFLEAESIEELADLLEVIEAVVETKKFDWKQLLDVKKKKADERGKFKDKIILEKS